MAKEKKRERKTAEVEAYALPVIAEGGASPVDGLQGHVELDLRKHVWGPTGGGPISISTYSPVELSPGEYAKFATKTEEKMAVGGYYWDIVKRVNPAIHQVGGEMTAAVTGMMAERAFTPGSLWFFFFLGWYALMEPIAIGNSVALQGAVDNLSMRTKDVKAAKGKDPEKQRKVERALEEFERLRKSGLPEDRLYPKMAEWAYGSDFPEGVRFYNRITKGLREKSAIAENTALMDPIGSFATAIESPWDYLKLITKRSDLKSPDITFSLGPAGMARGETLDAISFKDGDTPIEFMELPAIFKPGELSTILVPSGYDCFADIFAPGIGLGGLFDRVHNTQTTTVSPIIHTSTERAADGELADAYTHALREVIDNRMAKNYSARVEGQLANAKGMSQLTQMSPVQTAIFAPAFLFVNQGVLDGCLVGLMMLYGMRDGTHRMIDGVAGYEQDIQAGIKRTVNNWEGNVTPIGNEAINRLTKLMERYADDPVKAYAAAAEAAPGLGLPPRIKELYSFTAAQGQNLEQALQEEYRHVPVAAVGPRGWRMEK